MSSIPPDHKSRITDEGPLHKYRTEIPNTVIRGLKSRNLSTDAKWLYVYLKSVAGDNGQCYQSTTTIAAASGLSRAQVSRARKELSTANLIRITQPKHKNREPEQIRIVDIWPVNMQEFGVSLGNTSHDNINAENTEEHHSGVPLGNSGVPLGNSGVPLGNSGVPDMTTKKISLRRSLEEEKKDPLIVPPLPQKSRKLTPTNPDAQIVLDYLNTTHRRTFQNSTQIQTLLRTGVSVDDCKLVIDWLYAVERLENPDGYEKYGNNVTPFRPMNFDRNLDRAMRWKQQLRTATPTNTHSRVVL